MVNSHSQQHLGFRVLKASLLAADTDGIDGSENNAGAFVDGSTVQRLRESIGCPRIIEPEMNSYTGFDAVGDLFVTGPSGTM